jgi:hypothetical protein
MNISPIITDTLFFAWAIIEPIKYFVCGFYVAFFTILIADRIAHKNHKIYRLKQDHRKTD